MATKKPTHEDANLILRLFELRREEKFRKAREWFATSFKPASFEDVDRIAPMGSAENAYLRMVASYWEMAASFVASGVLNQDLFFQSGGELLFVWERLRPIVEPQRAARKNPLIYRNLETVAGAYANHMESHAPEAYKAFQAMVASVAAAAKSNKQ